MGRSKSAVWVKILSAPTARALFATGIPYAKWNEDDRKLVAGTLGREKSQQPGLDYGLFGSMGASGTFSNLVI